MAMHISYVGTGQMPAGSAPKVAAAPVIYSLTLKNRSAQPWIFYVYQKPPSPTGDLFSLTWFCSPYLIRVGDQIRFSWELAYDFVWADTGQLAPGVDFYSSASGCTSCDPAGANTTEFSLTPGPGLSAPTSGPPPGSLVVKADAGIPAQRYSIGIGMSGQGTYAMQAGPNMQYVFAPAPSYWIAAGTNVTLGTVLNPGAIAQSVQAKFPNAVYSLDCVFKDGGTWAITPA